MTSRLVSCARCQAYSLTHPALLDSCMEEVERNPEKLTVEVVLEAFLNRFHVNGHRIVVTR